MKTQAKRRARLFTDVPRRPTPSHVKPMAPTLTKTPFDHPDWFYEVKWDGYRAIAEVRRGEVRFYSRQQRPFDGRFRPVVECLKNIDHQAVLDGELVALDDKGIARFEWLQNYPRLGGQLAYYVFDLLHLNGRDLCGVPLERRKELLTKTLPALPCVKLCEHIERHGKALFQAAGEMWLEGIVAKDRKSLYHPGLRTKSWQKIKHRQRAEVLICGFTERPSSLLVGVQRGAELTYAGQIEFGFSRQELVELELVLAPLIQDACPFSKRPRTENQPKWVKPVSSQRQPFRNGRLPVNCVTQHFLAYGR